MVRDACMINYLSIHVNLYTGLLYFGALLTVGLVVQAIIKNHIHVNQKNMNKLLYIRNLLYIYILFNFSHISDFI